MRRPAPGMNGLAVDTDPSALEILPDKVSNGEPARDASDCYDSTGDGSVAGRVQRERRVPGVDQPPHRACHTRIPQTLASARIGRHRPVAATGGVPIRGSGLGMCRKQQYCICDGAPIPRCADLPRSAAQDNGASELGWQSAAEGGGVARQQIGFGVPFRFRTLLRNQRPGQLLDRRDRGPPSRAVRSLPQSR